MHVVPLSHRPRPLVGLTTSELRTPERVKHLAQAEPAMKELALGVAYPAAVERAGGVPVVVPALSADAIEPLLDGLGGLVLSGGPDLNPRTYGAEPHPRLGPTEDDIDLFELAVLAAAERRGLPVLCICRGMQTLNVARGGTLVQDLPSERGGAIEHRQTEPGSVATHPVTIAPDSRLAAVLGATEAQVNSFHHQAIDRLGEGLRAVAWAPDGTIEAVEAQDGELLLAVQWHAESLDGQGPLFEALVDAAGGRTDARRAA